MQPWVMRKAYRTGSSINTFARHLLLLPELCLLKTYERRHFNTAFAESGHRLPITPNFIPGSSLYGHWVCWFSALLQEVILKELCFHLAPNTQRAVSMLWLSLICSPRMVQFWSVIVEVRLWTNSILTLYNSFNTNFTCVTFPPTRATLHRRGTTLS